MVDNGLLRANEAEDVRKTLTEHFGVNLTVVDATDRFLTDLKGVTDPEQKRKIIGKANATVLRARQLLTPSRQRFHRGVQGESQRNRSSREGLAPRRRHRMALSRNDISRRD